MDCDTRFDAPSELAAVRIERTDSHVHVALPAPWRALSSAPLGGGLSRAGHAVILRVCEEAGRSPLAYPPPETTLERYCRTKDWDGPALGMMTAASMDSCRTSWRREGGVAVLVAVTSGLANARRAGDRADCRPEDAAAPPAGTINILAVTNASLTDAALAEALMLVAEARTAVLLASGVRSPVSGLPATGTGTDCAAVLCGDGPVLRWCGKHVFFGEMLARTVMEALSASIAWDAGR